MSTVEEALAIERARISFEPRRISEFLYGKEAYARILHTLNNNPALPYDFNMFNKGRVGIIKKSIQDFPTMYNALEKDGLTDENFIYLCLCAMNQMPGGVHIGMFMKCIEIMGSQEQQDEYLERGKKFEIVGCYAQTEMAHGSDVSSLMTTATLDEEKD